MTTFTYNIVKLAEKKARLGLTDKEIARRVRCHASTVKNVLTGKTAKPPTVKAIAEALGLDLADLVVASDSASPNDGSAVARESAPTGSLGRLA